MYSEIDVIVKAYTFPTVALVASVYLLSIDNPFWWVFLLAGIYIAAKGRR